VPELVYVSASQILERLAFFGYGWWDLNPRQTHYIRVALIPD
jgi:hypothetical protein